MSLERAHILMGQNRPEHAMKELHGVLAEEPDNPSAHVLMAICICDADGDYDDAIEHAREAIRIAPDWALTHYAHALSLHQAEQTNKAEEAVREALRLNPEDADYFALLSDILLQRRRWVEALAASEQGLDVDPEHTTCTNLRAIALNRLGRKEEAGATIDQALARDPENSATHANMGWTALHAGDPKKALHHFRESLRIDPENEWAQQGMLEGLKARYLVYRWILAYQFLMARLSEKAQWALLIGAYVVFRMVRAVGTSYPEWQPIVIPVTAAYLTFAFASWFSEPIFNALLLLNPFARLILPPRMRRAALIWVGLVACAVVSLVVFFFVGGIAWFLFGVYLLFMTLPINVTLSMRRPVQQRKAATYTGLLGLAGLLVVAGGGLGWQATGTLVPVFIIGWLGFQWYANALALQAR